MKKQDIIGAILSIVAVLSIFLLVGCGGMKKEEMIIPGDNGAYDKPHYIVMARLANSSAFDRAKQIDGEFHCTGKLDSITMASVRDKFGPNVLGYTGCRPLSQFKNLQYAAETYNGYGVLIVDGAKALVYAGAAAYGMHEISKGLGKSGDTVNQNGGNNSSGSNAEANHAENVGNKTTNTKIDNSKHSIDNSNTVKIVK